MRRYLVILLLAGCSVPEKHAATTDGGSDGSSSGGPLDTTITKAPDEFSSSALATFEFTANDPQARFECAFDGELPLPCVSPHMRQLSDGSHTFAVRATDGKGN